ncbi:MAG: LicD family protein [Lachnospiraceae bacterium]|nr:LicD family protein [Lachnospiraceae bacterium]
MLKFDSNFFEGETREGFFVEPLVKNAWAAQLETLEIFDEICKENNLIYAADWGTLLGAIRHKGFIPWDDDMDACMPRADMMKFFEIIDEYPILKCENPYNTPDIGIHATRIMLSDTTSFERTKLKENHGFPFPVGIDIFPIDYVPRDEEQEREQLDLMLKTNYAVNFLILENMHDEKEQAYHKAYLDKLKELKEALDIDFSEEYPKAHELTILYDELQQAYGESESDYVSELPCLMLGQDYYLPKDTYENIIRVPFENIDIPVPADYDRVLRVKYGEDYMTPQNISGGHDYPYFNRYILGDEDDNNRGLFEENKRNIIKITSDYYRNFLRQKAKPQIINAGENSIEAALEEVLFEIDRICKNHKIQYWVIDKENYSLAMKRPELMKFQSLLQIELDSWFDYRSIYTHRDHADLRMYVLTDGYMVDPKDYETRFHGCQEIVGIDIAPIDMVNDDDSVEALKVNIITRLQDTIEALPTERPYSNEVLKMIAQWEDLLDMEIDLEGNLQNEFVKMLDSIAMSDADESFSRCRISSDIGRDNYQLYTKEHFD